MMTTTTNDDLSWVVHARIVDRDPGGAYRPERLASFGPYTDRAKAEATMVSLASRPAVVEAWVRPTKEDTA